MNDEDKRLAYDILAAREPAIALLNDTALSGDDAHLDSFNLALQLGPLYDVLRHPATATPLSIAIYGTWGAGKTSAMHWLHGLLKRWNRSATAATGEWVRVHPVWFCPWKYRTREDV